jgi:L-fuculose-phosphate aldolase
MDIAAASDALIGAGRRLGQRGLIAAREGNLSIRLDEDRLLMTPSSQRKDELGPADLVIVWLGHRDRDTRSASGLTPSSDIALHLAAYAARPDVRAYAHAHLPAAMALTLAGERPDPAELPEMAGLLPRLGYVPLGAPGSQELAGWLAAALTEGPEPFADAVLLDRHGAVAVGDDPATAVDRLDLVEVLFRAWRDALVIRAARASLGIV